MTVRALRAGAGAENLQLQIGAGKIDSLQATNAFSALLKPAAEASGAKTRMGTAGTDRHFNSDKLPWNAAPHEQTQVPVLDRVSDASGQGISSRDPAQMDEKFAGLKSQTFSFRGLGVFGLYSQSLQDGASGRVDGGDGKGFVMPVVDEAVANGETVKSPGAMAEVSDAAVERADPAPNAIADLAGEQDAHVISFGPAAFGDIADAAPATLVREPLPTMASLAASQPFASGPDEDGGEPYTRATAGRAAPDVPQSPARDCVSLTVLGNDATIELVVRSVQGSPESLRVSLERVAAEFRCRIGEFVLNGSSLTASPSEKGGGYGRHAG